MTQYRLGLVPQAEHDVRETARWYQAQRAGLGLEFNAELRAAYARITAGPLRYPELRNGVRRTLLRRFPYAIFFLLEEETVRVFAVLHVSRNPAQWQRRQR